MSGESLSLMLAKSLWSALADGDAAALRGLLAGDVVWHASGHHPLAGPHHGPDGVIDYLARVGETSDDLRSSLQEVYVSDTGAVVAYHVSAKRGARVLDMDFLLRLEIRGEKIAWMRSTPADQKVNDAFWS